MFICFFSLKMVLLVSVSICVHCFPFLFRMVQPSHTGCHLPLSRPGGCPNPNAEMQCRRLPEELSFHGPDGNILWTVETNGDFARPRKLVVFCRMSGKVQVAKNVTLGQFSMWNYRYKKHMEL